MFLKSARVKGKEYIRIVESYRDEENKVKHKTIANLGRVDKLITLYPFFDKLIEKYIGHKYTSIENINKKEKEIKNDTFFLCHHLDKMLNLESNGEIKLLLLVVKI